MKLTFVYDASDLSTTALKAVVEAVARARAEGMPVEVEARRASASDAGRTPWVEVEGVGAEGVDVAAIFNAIARAHRRPNRLDVVIPSARTR